MIEIVTLFLGLVSGPQVVELAVGPAVAAVEIRLDGELVERRTSPPWRFEISLGQGLAPHELLALARDEAGRELARSRRWINLDLPRVEIEARAPPGGLTPLPLSFADGAIPAAAEMQSWFLAEGKPLPVSAVRAGPAEVVVVRHPGAAPGLEELARAFLAHELDRIGLRARPARGESPVWSPELLRLPSEEFQRAALELSDVPAGAPERIRIGRFWQAYRRAAGLGDATAVRFISPLAAPVSRSDSSRHLFASSAGVADVGLLWLARKVRPIGFDLRLADAVAVAGREAHATGRRRAVVLLLDGETGDRSLYGAAAVRDYLRALRVPLFVWAFSRAVTTTAWGEARFVGLERTGRSRRARSGDVREAFDRLDEAAAELRRRLDRQRIVLLGGKHLPDRVELAAEAAGARPAGLDELADKRGDGTR